MPCSQHAIRQPNTKMWAHWTDERLPDHAALNTPILGLAFQRQGSQHADTIIWETTPLQGFTG